MKYIKPFRTYESVIVPDKTGSDMQIRNIDDLKEYGNRNDFDVVEYDEFYDSLSDEDKKTAPPKPSFLSIGPPFFALFHPTNKRPMFVICDKMAIKMPFFKEVVNDIISHEKVHGEQNLRRGKLTFKLPNPNIEKEYFSNKDEIMAFSWTIAQEISRISTSFEEAIKQLDNPRFVRNAPPKQYIRLWDTIKTKCDPVVVNRYRRNIYNYLQELFNKNKK
jgi:hypothetical protein